MSRAWAILIWLDQGLSAIFLASPDETFSAACYRLEKSKGGIWSKLRKTIDIIFFWEDSHCEKSFQSEVNRKHLPYPYSMDKRG